MVHSVDVRQNGEVVDCYVGSEEQCDAYLEDNEYNGDDYDVEWHYDVEL